MSCECDPWRNSNVGLEIGRIPGAQAKYDRRHRDRWNCGQRTVALAESENRATEHVEFCNLAGLKRKGVARCRRAWDQPARNRREQAGNSGAREGGDVRRCTK